MRKVIRVAAFYLVVMISLDSFGYTVILKSGKKFQGTLIAEDDSVIQLKDQDGIVLSFKKSLLDLQAMQNINPKENQQSKSVTNPEQVLRDKAQEFNDRQKAEEAADEVPTKPGEAAKNKVKERKNSRKITNKDIVDLYGSSAIKPEVESETLSSEEGDQSKEQTEEDREKEGDEVEDLANEERFWREKSRELHRALTDLKQRRDYAETECERTIEGVDPDGNLALAMYQKERECEEYRKLLEKELDRVEQDLKDFEDQGRRLGIPWEWIEDR